MSSTIDRFFKALEKKDISEADRLFREMSSSEVAKIGTAFKKVGRPDLAQEINQHAALRALGEMGVRIRIHRIPPSSLPRL